MDKNEDKKIRVCIALTKKEHEQLKRIAKRERRSVSNLISVWTAASARE